ncbi:unnamed protein product [Orchesella dallaii]|uniref:Uncharacterized protein n=1 Tax=Orchesella dallaii TaxID=48710 RepID=A0ABP1Q7Z0_9HEXA
MVSVRINKQVQSCIINSLPQFLRINSEKYTVYFTIPKDINLLTDADSHCPKILGKILIIHVETTFHLKRLVYRHSNTYNVIISRLSNENPTQSVKDTVMAFINTVVPSKTLFLFTTKMKLNIPILLKTSHTLPVFPALKAVLHISNKIVSSLVILNCLGGYKCPPTSNLLEKDLEFDFIHRSLHKNAYGSILHGLPESTAPAKKLGKNVGKCRILIKYLDPNCPNDIMAFLTLAEVSNSTLFLHQKTPATIQRLELYKFITPVEHIVYAMFLNPERTVPLAYINQLHFDKYDSTSILYCEKGRKHLRKGKWFQKVSIWFDPFTTGVWVGFKLTLVSILLCFYVDGKIGNFLFACINLISVVFGHGDWNRRRRYYFVANAIAFLFLLYGNSLLCNVTTISSPAGFSTLKELLEIGKYKIAWLPRAYKVPPQHYFDFDFKLIGWDHQRLNESFHYLPNSRGILELVPEMAEKRGNLKLAVIYPSSKSDVMLNGLTQLIKKFEPSSICFKVKQTLNPRLFSWTINMENQYWILKTLEQIVESGLFSQWRMRALWGSLWSRVFFHGSSSMQESLPNYIDLEEFKPILIIWLGLIVVSFAVFFFEMSDTTMY